MNFSAVLKKNLLLFFLFLFTFQTVAQSINGTVKSSDGEPLPFATIYIRNLETGTTTNSEGYFEYKLQPGKYDLVFQYLGYKSQVKFVEVSSESTALDIVLNPHTFMLRDVVVEAGKEDPAYTIMRKAIAKAKYHLQQLDAYSAQVYIKGSGRMLDSPFFLRKQMAKEGIDSTTAFVEESIRKVKYNRPNTYEEQVISIRSNGDDNNTSPSEFINGSFYEPKIANAISPLSPKAFANYRFEYLGTFKDRDYEVSKIRVIPRSRGDGVFDGEIFIVEDYWSIHSLDFNTSYLGIEFKVNQIYNPIQDKAWLPISHKFYVHGTFFGFEFEYNYLATISDYEITLNQDLVAEIVVVDEKVDKELASELEQQNKNISAETIEKMKSGEQMTRKELRKLMRNYEKMEKERDTIPDVQYIKSLSIDSLASKQDSSYWEIHRPVPLSEYEIKGYHKMDSMTVVRQNEADGDTIKTNSKKKGFHLTDILFGNTYKVGNKAHFKLFSPLLNVNFNTVEGYNFFYKMNFTKTFENKHWLQLEPNIRYAFSRKMATGSLKATYRFGQVGKKKSIVLTGGKYVSQLNVAEPIHPIINTFSTLMFEDNFMKLYEREFLALQFNSRISEKYSYNIKAEYVNRLPLRNNSDHIWFDDEAKTYSTNAPNNVEIGNTSFGENNAFLSEFNLSMKPWTKFYIENNKKKVISDSSPEIQLKYRNAIASGDAQISYHNVEAALKHVLDIGIRGTLNFNLLAGTFLSDENMSFADFKHFQGNRTAIQIADAVSSYRLLPYYEFSTSGNYVNLLSHYQFRKFFLSRFKFVQKRGIKESVFLNYLGTEYSDHYTEVGYGIENIFRVFRVEGVISFQDGEYRDWGVRVGIASNLDRMFDFD
ncbi:MAG: carboxypeptidase-like regulatory domain-containing protein [Cyclobacteriaceae bacterium]